MWKGLGALLAQNPSKRGMMVAVSAALTVEDAERVIADLFPKLAKLGRVESAAQGILVIRAASSIGMQEFSLRKMQLMQALKDRGIGIRDVRVVMHLEQSYDA